MKTPSANADRTGHRYGIRARLLTLLLPCIVGLLALDSWNDYREMRTLVQDAYDQNMLESVNALKSSLSVGKDGALRLNPPFVVQALFDPAGPQHKHVHVGLTAKTPAAGSTATPLNLLGDADLPPPPSAAGEAVTSPLWYDSVYRNVPVRMVALRDEVTDGKGNRFDLLIQLAETTTPRDQAQAASLKQELFRDARLVLVMVLLVWLGIAWSLRPLERLRKSVLQSKNHDIKPLDASGVPHEVAPLVDAINQQVASYRDLLDKQSQFLADASHQLRTPLAIMLTQAGVALREKDPSQWHDTLRAMVAQLTRSRRLSEQLLSLAHANDSAAPEEALHIVDLNAVAREVVLQYLTLAHDKDQDLGWIDARDGAAGVQPAVPVLADGPELHEVLANLVHNAIVYTPVGGSITVRAYVQGTTAFAEVSDSGPGIPAARRAEVFERFRQAEHIPGKAPQGAGLGLAIARAYARRNNGEIGLGDVEQTETGMKGSGLRAVLSLPLATPASTG